jgi:micrococcal nuclease
MRWLLFTAAMLFCNIGAAAPLFSGPYSAELVRVIDGDTYELIINVWPEVEIHTNLRLLGVDTPELSSKQPCEVALALDAKAYVTDLFGHAGTIYVVAAGTDKYGGRFLGGLQLDGRDLASQLILAGKAHPYNGGKKQRWC